MHYSQKRRYYFFIAITKFKTILSYSLAQACSLCLAAYPSSHTRLCQLADFPSLILRLSFAQGSLKVRSRFAQGSLKVRSTFAQPSLKVRSAGASLQLVPNSKFSRRLSFAQGSLILRSTFAQGSLMIAPHTLANFQSLPKLISCSSLAQACSLCPIQNSKFIILLSSLKV